MIKRCLAFLLFVFAALPTASFAKDDSQPQDSGKTKKNFMSFHTEKHDFQLVPVPVYETSPHEGNSYGIMPVVTMSDKGDDSIKALIGLIAQYNTVTSFDLAGLAYFFPEPEREIKFFAQQAMKYAREFSASFIDPHLFNDKIYLDVSTGLVKSPFGRFYGIGPDRTEKNQSNYVSRDIAFRATGGYYVLEDLRLNYGFNFHSVDVLNRAMEQYDDTLSRYGALPNVVDSTNFIHDFSVTFDNRAERDYAKRGTFAQAKYSVSSKSLGSDKTFQTVELEAIQLIPVVENRYTLALRGNARQMVGDDIPFYELSSLGGAFDMRGFIPGRFVDRGKVLLQVENRIRAFSMDVMNKHIDLFVDPFVELGRVFDSPNDLGFDKWQPAAGVGFRLFVPPNVIGRLDAAVSSDGLHFYTELGYPF